MFIISLYHVTREYGGPEEGGWWYERPRAVGVVGMMPTEDDAYACARACNAATPPTRETWTMWPGDDEACSSSGHLSFLVDEEYGEHELTERPRYE